MTAQILFPLNLMVWPAVDVQTSILRFPTFLYWEPVERGGVWGWQKGGDIKKNQTTSTRLPHYKVNIIDMLSCQQPNREDDDQHWRQQWYSYTHIFNNRWNVGKPTIHNMIHVALPLSHYLCLKHWNFAVEWW